MVSIAPSIASAPMARLQETVRDLELGGADYLHFDIEDGCFVPVMNLGTRIIREVRPLTGLLFDVHLMMVNPEWLIPQLAAYGANRVSVHFEACEYPRRTLGLICQYGLKAGLAFNPKTPLPPLQHYRPFLHYVDILTTEPEIGECSYLPDVLKKVSEGRAQDRVEGVEWMVDGGITAENARAAVLTGADILVTGRAVFDHGDIRENIRRIRDAANGQAIE